MVCSITLNDPWLYHAVLLDFSSRPSCLDDALSCGAAGWDDHQSRYALPAHRALPGALLTARELLSRPLGAVGPRSNTSSGALRHTEPHAVRLWQQMEGQQLDARIMAFVAAADNTDRR
jgi:hypothetical protein